MSENFGLAFAGIFDGSMYGTSPVVFSVWFYVIANGFGGEIDLHPKKLADTLGTTVADVQAAIRLHCAPDPTSRSQAHEGRRLLHLGGVRYAIVNHDLYKNARALEEKRASDRLRKQASRERQRGTVEVPILDLSQKSVTERDPLLSSPSDLISSDPEGVQGEGDHAPPQPSRFAPADFVPTGAQRERCRELGHDLDELVRAFKRQEFNRGYTDWGRRFDKWVEEEPRPPARASSPAPAKAPRRPPWIDVSHAAVCREHAVEVAAMAREFATTHHVPPDCLRVGDARAAFSAFLTARFGPATAAA
jgi:hypothetical protein